MEPAAYGLTATADLCDQHGEAVSVCETHFGDYGGITAFSGEIVTVRCFEDNVLVRQTLEGEGRGKVLVVDGGGSLRCALFGDMLAQTALDNGWAGVIVNGCIRDVAVIVTLPIGVKALGTHPRKSEKRGEGAVNVPVSFGAITFRPGERVFADEDGVVVLK
ncbi:ribonuclease E activity regulator RraA [Thioalkalivibrio sulfidiphilus]|uniref:ribonuclease E activity regulator RraA n=1 Tax=Thioalkalivibrio sulfidiphilus TaxID=1033854 RepID=UPI003B365BAE